MNIKREFSKHAHSYQKFNQIQTEVAKTVVSTLTCKEMAGCKPTKILDLGCGSGTLYKLIDWKIEKFVGVDFSSPMLALHPKSKTVTCKLGDFNDAALFAALKKEDFECIVSASALQWADDLEKVLRNIANLSLPFSLAIFSAGTFATLHATAGINSIIPSYEMLKELSQKCLHVNAQKVLYQLEFDNTREMFAYIKKSGVSAHRNLLTYKATKKLMQEYPLHYLEFEVVYINSFSNA